MLPDPILVGRDADKVEALAKRFNVDALVDRSRQGAGRQERHDLLRRRDHPGASHAADQGDQRRQARLLREADRDQSRRGDRSAASSPRQGRQERHGAGQAVPARPARSSASCAIPASSAACSRCAASSATGCSRATGRQAQRPSWNYRSEDGGGIILDMVCHWRYVLDNLFGEVECISCLGATHIPERVDENGQAATRRPPTTRPTPPSSSRAASSPTST